MFRSGQVKVAALSALEVSNMMMLNQILTSVPVQASAGASAPAPESRAASPAPESREPTEPSSGELETSKPCAVTSRSKCAVSLRLSTATLASAVARRINQTHGIRSSVRSRATDVRV